MEMCVMYKLWFCETVCIYIIACAVQEIESEKMYCICMRSLVNAGLLSYSLITNGILIWKNYS